MKKLLSFVFLLSLGVVFAADAVAPKYILLFIGDGMSMPQRMMADEYSVKNGKGHLTLNSLPVQAPTRTRSANSLVTDSAAAATAIACGEKTNSGSLGVGTDGVTRFESSAEVAHKLGKKVGILTTVTINHATPAGFYAHQKSRGSLYRIGLDLIASDFDFFAGGGFSGKENDTKDTEYKGNLYDLAKQANYKVISDKDEFLALKPGAGKVLYYGAQHTLPFALDYTGATPTLAQMTAKCIEMLSDSPNGFFMMVEGGKIDYAGHANDAATNLFEVCSFDEAIRVGYEFYQQHEKETLLVVTGDHETGGMTMGFSGTGYNLFMERLANQKCSAEAFGGYLKAAQAAKADFNFEDAKALLNQYFGFLFDQKDAKDPMYINAKELEALKAAFTAGKLKDEARRTIDGKAGVGWTSGAHTALPVLTTSIGVGSERFGGYLDNTDIAKRMKALLMMPPPVLKLKFMK